MKVLFHQKKPDGRQVRIAQNEKTLEISIFDVIGDSFFGGVSLQDIQSQIQNAKDANNIRVLINSPGGSYFEGVAIYNLLKMQNKPVSVRVLGLAASAASVIAMAGSEIIVEDGSMLMIHEASSIAFGTADNMRKEADLIDQLNDNAVSIYATQSELPVDEIRSLMADETWMNGEQAVNLGFATGTSAPTSQASMCFDLKNDKFKFKNIPKDVLEKYSKKESNTNINIIPLDSLRINELALPLETDTVLTTENNVVLNTTKDNLKLKENNMKSLIQFLNLGPDANEGEVLLAIQTVKAELNKLVSASGAENVSEALGFIASGVVALGEVESLNKEIEGLKAQLKAQDDAKEKAERDAIIAKLEEEGKLDSEVKEKFLPMLKDLAALKAFAATAQPRVPTRKIKEPAEVSASSDSACSLVWNGKTYDKLTNPEREQLAKEDKNLFAKMRTEYKNTRNRK